MSLNQSFISARGKSPQISENVFVAEGAKIIGDVTIGESSSVWYNTTLRGDVMPIVIGKETNIQDGSTLHGTFGKFACLIGDRVTVGHNVILHGCKIGSGTLVGMGSIIMDGAVVPDHCVVGAGSLITEGKKFEPYSLIMGRPAVFKRRLNDEEIKFLEQSADNYILYKSWYNS
jgi:carbonic anhydrase/acetyltransferase-like protein (isoleucine patch superfamily)